MDATTVVAIYAAVVATGGALVQFAQWRAGRTQVVLKISAGTAPVLTGETDELGDERVAPREVVFIQITNRSAHPVKVDSVGAIRVDGSGRNMAFLRPYPLHQRLPIEIPARDNALIWVLRSGFADAEEDRLKFVAGTAGDDDFETKPLLLRDLPRLTYHGSSQWAPVPKSA